jgi:large subunit ribosomal protein L39
MKMSALAVVNGKKWDMHRPLKESCTLELINFRNKETYDINRAFWRTCSFVVGGVLQKTFRREAGLHLHSFPRPHIESGSFTYDFALKDQNWHPTPNELRAFGVEMHKFAILNDKIERLEVQHDIAFEIFKDNPIKREQLPSISNANKGIITLYRAGDHIDISKGPMVASTRFINKVRIASIHRISNEGMELYRIQGVALPLGFTMSAYAFNIISDRAKKLVSDRHNGQRRNSLLKLCPFQNSVGLNQSKNRQNEQSDREKPKLQQRI